MILAPIGWVIEGCRWLDGVFVSLWSAITAGWQAVLGYFSSNSPVEIFDDFVGLISGAFSGLWRWLKSSATDAVNWLIGKLNVIPGVNIDPVQTGDTPVMAPPAGAVSPRMERGGIARTITHNSQTDRGTRVDQVNIYPQNQETFDSLLESRELAAP